MKYTLVSVLAALILTGCGVMGQRYGEEALYATLFSDSDYEIRQYEPLIIAQTPVDGSYRKATNQGYQRLTDYVSGNNRAEQGIGGTQVDDGVLSNPKVELTTPYYQEYIEGIWLTSVALPERYTLATLPIPTDKLITFQTLPRMKIAVIKFRGIRSERIINNKADQLMEWVKQEGLTATSAPRAAIFDPPLTIPGLSRFEIHVTVE